MPPTLLLSDIWTHTRVVEAQRDDYRLMVVEGLRLLHEAKLREQSLVDQLAAVKEELREARK